MKKKQKHPDLIDRQHWRHVFFFLLCCCGNHGNQTASLAWHVTVPACHTDRQKLVSFMCGLGLVVGAAAAPTGLSAPGGLSGDAVTSDDGEALPRRPGGSVCERVGLVAADGGPVGDAGAAGLRRGDVGDGGVRDDGAPACRWRGAGVTEKAAGVLWWPKRASSSPHAARLRLVPSAPPAASEPLASSWQRSTKLPLRAHPHSRSAKAPPRGPRPHSACRRGYGLEPGRHWGP